MYIKNAKNLHYQQRQSLYFYSFYYQMMQSDHPVSAAQILVNSNVPVAPPSNQKQLLSSETSQMPVTNTSATWIHHSNSKNRYKNVTSNVGFMEKMSRLLWHIRKN
jgi:hypothetical protein